MPRGPRLRRGPPFHKRRYNLTLQRVRVDFRPPFSYFLLDNFERIREKKNAGQEPNLWADNFLAKVWTHLPILLSSREWKQESNAEALIGFHFRFRSIGLFSVPAPPLRLAANGGVFLFTSGFARNWLCRTGFPACQLCGI